MKGKQPTAHATDVVAEDYDLPSKDLGKTIISNRINKEVVHLTFDRVGIGTALKQWPFKNLIPEILKECAKFLTHLDAKFSGAALPPEIRKQLEARKVEVEKALRV